MSNSRYMKKCYNYSRDTFEFTSAVEADMDPLASGVKASNALQEFDKSNPHPIEPKAPEFSDEDTDESKEAKQKDYLAKVEQYDKDFTDFMAKRSAVATSVEPEYLLPAFATFITPLAPKEGKLVVFDEAKQAWNYIDAPTPEKEKEPTVDELAAEARDIRIGLLVQSDWTQLADVPLSATQLDAWKKYRQALRDVPAQKGFPKSINWPEVPKYGSK